MVNVCGLVWSYCSNIFVAVSGHCDAFVMATVVYLYICGKMSVVHSLCCQVEKEVFFFLSCHRRHHHHSCVDISVPLGQRCLYLFITPFISATAATAAIVSCHKNHSKLFFLFKNIFETVKNIFLQYPNFSL